MDSKAYVDGMTATVAAKVVGLLGRPPVFPQEERPPVHSASASSRLIRWSTLLANLHLLEAEGGGVAGAAPDDDPLLQAYAMGLRDQGVLPRRYLLE